jgi:DUF2889 family protein
MSKLCRHDLRLDIALMPETENKRVMTFTKPPQFPLARRGAGHAPSRRPGSIRRTTSIESRWPAGFGHDTAMVGRARDLVTPLDGDSPVTVATACFHITASPRREILTIAIEPRHAREQELVGVRAGAASREALANALGDVKGAALFQLLDDFAGASLVAGWIWSHWDPNLMRQIREQGPPPGFKGPRANICIGFADGSSALDALDRPMTDGPGFTEVLHLENPEDPQGWHEMLEPGGPTARRARRIDVWREGDIIRIDAGFQDSGNRPDGKRVAIHEYRVRAAVDPRTMTVLSLDASPLILPFAECPGASTRMSKMVGLPIHEYRQRVIDMLPGAEGCTHLNDVLRALADVPELAARLS